MRPWDRQVQYTEKMAARMKGTTTYYIRKYHRVGRVKIAPILAQIFSMITIHICRFQEYVHSPLPSKSILNDPREPPRLAPEKTEVTGKQRRETRQCLDYSMTKARIAELLSTKDLKMKSNPVVVVAIASIVYTLLYSSSVSTFLNEDGGNIDYVYRSRLGLIVFASSFFHKEATPTRKDWFERSMSNDLPIAGYKRLRFRG